MNTNSKLALAGVFGAITYAIADLFLFMGTDLLSVDILAVCNVPEWRLMTSMWIGSVGSLLLLLGFMSLLKMYKAVFTRVYKFLILPALLCFGGVLYMHFVLGVYAPLTYNSAIKAGIPVEQISVMLNSAKAWLDPLTITLVLLGYSTEIVLLYGIFSGRLGLKKRVAGYMFGGYAVVVLLIVLFGRITGEWGILGSVESLLETTFFIPAFLYWKRN